MGKKEAIIGLRAVLKESFDIRYAGADIRRHARVQGLADGYMRALVDLGVAEERELIEIVNEERRQATCRADAEPVRPSRAEAFA